MSRFSMDWSELSLQMMITFGHFLWQDNESPSSDRAETGTVVLHAIDADTAVS
jgi:hypothetical protein